MKVFFDTEFTGLYKDTKLISIGLIDEDGKQLYLENNEIDIDSICDVWLLHNVFYNTIYYGNNEVGYLDIVNKLDEYFCGNMYQIKEKLKKYFSKYDYVELVSDVCHYDMVLLIDIFGHAFSLPENVSPCCYDVNQLLAREKVISMREAFDLNREELVTELRM